MTTNDDDDDGSMYRNKGVASVRENRENGGCVEKIQSTFHAVDFISHLIDSRRGEFNGQNKYF